MNSVVVSLIGSNLFASFVLVQYDLALFAVDRDSVLLLLDFVQLFLELC